jgi:hypothetical protein
VALLHSFGFQEAIAGFNEVLAADASCGIAYWGIALSQWGNPFAGGRTPTTFQNGWATIEKAQSAVPSTQRERDYIAAAAELYRDYATRDERTRRLAYEKAMEELARKYRDDSEARIFYALALNGTALPTDKSYANQLKAAELLDVEFARQPNHPGIAHYIIHSYDVPVLAPRALDAARRYASIAPSAPHALHMPSHTFTRVGDWDASIATNIRSAEEARKEKQPGAALHASDYMVYAYLQTGRDQAAKRVIDQAEQGGDLAAAFANAAMPARYAIERLDWNAAKALEVRPAPSTPYTEAITRFVRAVAFAKTAEVASAKSEVAELEKLRDALSNDAYWKEQVEIQRLAASAWVAYAEGNRSEALSLLRTAADREDATEKSAVTPGPLKPAREQLGEMLLESNQAAQALREFESTLKREPRRFRAVYGAARAARLSGDQAKARSYFQQLVEICDDADTTRPELAEARQAIG